MRYDIPGLGSLHVKGSENQVNIHIDLFNPRNGVLGFLGHMFGDVLAGTLVPGICLDPPCLP